MTPIEVRRTGEFDDWFERLRDRRAKARIAQRLVRLGQGHFGDCRPVGSRISELKIDTGPGYRLYYTRRGSALVVLLCAGDKSSQDRDIVRAKALAETS